MEENKMKKEIYAQQGDVILYKIASVPKIAKRINIKTNNFIIERGEGVNTHEIVHKNLNKAALIFEDNDNIYIQAKEQLELIHQEHGTFVLIPDLTYLKKKEREWDYETQEAKNVLD